MTTRLRETRANKFRVIIFCLFALSLAAGCENQQTRNEYWTAGYKQGHTQGKQEGYNEGNSAGLSAGQREGYRKGYAEGFAAVFPSTNHGYSAVLGTTSTVLASLALIKILLSIVILNYLLIERSASKEELAAKIIFGVLGSIIAYFTAPLLGIQSGLSKFLLLSSPDNSVLVWSIILVSAVSTYWIARGIQLLYPHVHGVWVEVWTVLVSVLLGTVLVSFLFHVFTGAAPAGYVGGDILIGVTIGVMTFFAVKLVEIAVKKRNESDKKLLGSLFGASTTNFIGARTGQHPFQVDETVNLTDAGSNKA